MLVRHIFLHCLLFSNALLSISSSLSLSCFRFRFCFCDANFNSYVHYPSSFVFIMIHSTFFGTLMSILCHWSWLMRASSADPTCYFPNEKVASTYQPCNSTDDDHASVCCELSTSVCSTKGLCYGSNGYLYRGGCTDRSWKSALCPTVCLTGTKLSVKFTKTM